jgi:hypothetical protein
MIISLFMDETPMMCGSGHSLGTRGSAVRPDGRSERERCRGDAHREHDQQAEDFHLSPLPKNSQKPLAGFSW